MKTSPFGSFPVIRNVLDSNLIPSQTEAKTLLQKWREENCRCAENVREIWYQLQGQNLGDEREFIVYLMFYMIERVVSLIVTSLISSHTSVGWLILEQVCMAGLDLHDAFLVKECITELDKKFPGSSRVSRLNVMAKLELRSRYDEANKCYEKLIAKDKTNALYYKRRVAVLEAQGRSAEAIKELTEYLKKFMNDNEAWSELCDLYVSEQEYTKAVFCAEELILAHPHNFLNHLRYAEIQYTINTAESLELARSYFAHAHKLNRESVRVLYGLHLATHALLHNTGNRTPNPVRQKELIRVRDYAVEQLQKLYSKAVIEKVQTLGDGKSNDNQAKDTNELSELLNQVLNI